MDTFDTVDIQDEQPIEPGLRAAAELLAGATVQLRPVSGGGQCHSSAYVHTHTYPSWTWPICRFGSSDMRARVIDSVVLAPPSCYTEDKHKHVDKHCPYDVTMNAIGTTFTPHDAHVSLPVVVKK